MNIFQRIGAWLRTYVFVVMDEPPLNKRFIIAIFSIMFLHGISIATMEYYYIDIPRLWVNSSYIILGLIYIVVSVRLDWDFYKQGIRMKQLVCQLILWMLIFAFYILCVKTRQKYMR